MKKDSTDKNKHVLSLIPLFFSNEYVTHKNMLAISHFPQRLLPVACINVVARDKTISIHVR